MDIVITGEKEMSRSAGKYMVFFLTGPRTIPIGKLIPIRTITPVCKALGTVWLTYANLRDVFAAPTPLMALPQSVSSQE